MWCRQCQQDVPAIASSGERKFCCPRCGEDVGVQCPADTDAKTSSSDPPPASARAEEMPTNDCWELDERLWDIAQVLQVETARGHRREKADGGEVTRFDQAHEIKASGTVFNRGSINSSKKTVPDTFISALIWSALSLGTAALVCGGVLLGWSLWTGRGELWSIGLPIAAGGMICLLIGLALEINRFSRDNHHTVSKLDEVDEKLRDLKTIASFLDAGGGPSSAAFYTHLAGGANPQLLLSDLKGQLDLLETEIGDQE